ncbi:MAG: hypothetical protein IJ408_03810 [Clostridia bacterium]|nr:hypothetical protein [Clostridia bacterium]
MNSRIKMFLICFASLCLGSAVYILSRPDVYISKFVLQMLNVKEYTGIFPSFVSFYIPDFLWATSLCSGLFAVYPLKAKKSLIWGIITFLYGALWEFFQAVSIVSGTADIIDVILYLTAAVVVVAINYYLKKREEK